ncbi:MAG: hypothetical protein R2838_01590 [Caldilineaceae bacterium]
MQIIGPITDNVDEVLTPEALAFVAGLHRTFNARRWSCCAPALRARTPSTTASRRASCRRRPTSRRRLARRPALPPTSTTAA